MNEKVNALVLIYQANLQAAKANLLTYLNSSVGVGEHPDILDAIEKELAVIAQYHDQLEVLEKYIKR